MKRRQSGPEQGERRGRKAPESGAVARERPNGDPFPLPLMMVA